MNILSFDVGTRNLAWAYFKESKLTEYDLINLIKKPKCFLCNKESMYELVDGVNVCFFCSSHKEKKCRKIAPLTPEEICFNLIYNLREIFGDHKIDVVVIENQPAFKNPHMKSIQSMIMTYFVYNKIRVVFQNPSLKLFGNKIENKKQKYKETKALGIKLCKEKVGDAIFNDIIKHQKIDDLTDAILHGLYYISNL